VDGIERDLGGSVQVLRLDVGDSVGRDLAIRYGVRGVPFLVLLDGEGRVVLKQAGTPRPEEVLRAADQLG